MARTKLQETVKNLGDEDRNNMFGAAAGLADTNVEPNAILYSNADCTDPQLRYTTAERLSWGVDWVWQKKAPENYAGGHVAWVIDSGIGTGFYGELNSPHQYDCTQSGCPNDGQATDRVGHGTMIAGIIGAKKDNKKGIFGVAPGATINSLRVVDDSTGQLNLSSVVIALNWMLGNVTDKDDKKPDTPSPGDVVNLSLGTAWLPGSKTQSKIEESLRLLADKGLKISIAAGNANALNGVAYVHAITPARAGGYGPTAKGGLIATVSAFDNAGSFWRFSAFGNYFDYFDQDKHKQRVSLPSYSEPGVDILSLWPGPNLAICSGTSLAAAHLSGILLWGNSIRPARSRQIPQRKSWTCQVTTKPSCLTRLD